MTLPSELPAQLSSIAVSSPTRVATHGISSAQGVRSTVPHTTQLSESVANVLTSAGIPNSVATSLAPVVVGSPPEAGATGTLASNDMEQQKRKAGIDAIVHWILQFFRINRLDQLSPK